MIPYPPTTQSPHIRTIGRPWPWSPLPCLWHWPPPEPSSTRHNPARCQATFGPSRAFQATQTTEFGDHIVFGSGPTGAGQRSSVVFSSWACQTSAPGTRAAAWILCYHTRRG